MEAALGRVMSTDEITEGRLTLTASLSTCRSEQKKKNLTNDAVLCISTRLPIFDAKSARYTRAK